MTSISHSDRRGLHRRRSGVAVFILAFAWAGLAVGGPVFAADVPVPPDGAPAAVAGGTGFESRIAPLLASRCGACHGPESAESGFRIDLRERAMAGGDSGAAGIVPGQPEASELLARIVTDDPESRMPAEGDPLSAEEQAWIRDWIASGAEWPDAMAELPGSLLPRGAAPAVKGLDHWSLRPIQRPAVPEPPQGEAWRGGPPLTAVDAFLAEILAQKGLTFNPEADPRSLIRRLSFDLVGLPPTPEEIDAFERACREERAVTGRTDSAYGELVDRLLASPHHGERWARHWLDVVRFAESDGFETNKARANAWPYRDWVIESLNADIPYDDFLRRQLCGDLLGTDAATGFLVGGPVDRVKSPDPVLTATQRADELHDMVSTTSSAFLGLTVGCARCHDHKFDAVPQADYYRLKAVFAGVRHGERPIQSKDSLDREQQIAEIESQLSPLVRRLGELQPRARLRRTIVIDDMATGLTEAFVKPAGVAGHAAGTARGEASQPGSIAALPNLGRQYQWWQAAPGQVLFAYAPKAAGSFRIWVSWGAGWATHARDVRYVLDADGNPATTDDQTTILTADQRLFADGSGEPPPGRPLWSGLADCGVRSIAEASRLLVVAGAATAPVSADVVVFEESDAGDEPNRTPHLRAPVSPRESVDAFAPVTARFVRFTVLGTTAAEPCLDELEVFAADGRNVAIGARPTASGTYADNASHRLEHINDGRYGNKRSWISNEIGRGWVQLELPEAEEIVRVVWSRDRSPKPEFHDRLVTKYEIAVSSDGRDWRPVASQVDRLPHDHAAFGAPPASDQKVEILTASALSPNELAEYESLSATVAELRGRLEPLKVRPMAYAGQFGQPEKTFRLFRGDPMAAREEVAPGGLAHVGSPLALASDAPEPERRRALAEWIVSPGNPLTPRVIVNRLWHYHFGTGIVDTPSDLGVNGGAPTHPRLLDWLSSELVDPPAPAERWRLKRIHRLIVMSRAYRQASSARPEALLIDSGSRLLWRYPPRRLEAEPLRDAILAVSGSLDTTMGGPGFDLFEPNTNYVKVYVTKTSFTEADFRRMVYQSKPRAELDTFFGAFDCPDAGQVQPARTVSTTPLQALNMLNGGFLLDQADRFARRVEREAGGDAAAQVARAIALAFGRPATDRELTAGRALVSAHGLTLLCRSLYNASEFITVY
jgi:mono/diheme cytochrome c family protein